MWNQPTGDGGFTTQLELESKATASDAAANMDASDDDDEPETDA